MFRKVGAIKQTPEYEVKSGVCCLEGRDSFSAEVPVINFALWELVGIVKRYCLSSSLLISWPFRRHIWI